MYSVQTLFGFSKSSISDFKKHLFAFGFLWVTLKSRCYCNFGRVFLALGANPKGHVFDSICFQNVAKIRVFGVLSSITGAKIMAQKPNFPQKKNATLKERF